MKLKQIFRINLLCIWCSAIHPCRVVMNSNWGDFITRPTKHPFPNSASIWRGTLRNPSSVCDPVILTESSMFLKQEFIRRSYILWSYNIQLQLQQFCHRKKKKTKTKKRKRELIGIKKYINYPLAICLNNFSSISTEIFSLTPWESHMLYRDFKQFQNFF